MNPATRRHARWLVALAAAALFAPLGAPYVGEEGVYTLMALEMGRNHDWWQPTLFGMAYSRPPLFQWLTVPLAEFLGWRHVLAATRLVAIAATLGTAAILHRLVRGLGGDRDLALFAVLAFFSGDVLVKRGWLAYADPLFALFTFAAIGALILAVHRPRPGLLLPAVTALSLAFLSKVFTAYLFYGVALAVLLWRHPNRGLLWRPSALLLHLAALVFPFAWHFWISGGRQGGDALPVILHKLQAIEPGPYLARLLGYPLETLLKLAPLSLVALWLRYRAPGWSPPAPQLPMALLLWVLGLNYLPYWLAPEGNIRYLMPLYPLFALLWAWWILGARAGGARLALRWMTAFVLLAGLWGLWGLPWFQAQRKNGDYPAVAAAILARTHGHPLYYRDTSATGLAVAAEIDLRRLPGPLLRAPPPDWDDGFLVSDRPEGRVSARFDLPEHRLFLLCRGPACAAR